MLIQDRHKGNIVVLFDKRSGRALFGVGVGRQVEGICLSFRAWTAFCNPGLRSFPQSSINFSFFQVIPQKEFKIPDGHRHHRWRHQFRRLTPHKGAPNGALCSWDLVITDVYDEILNSRTGGNSLGAMLNYRE
jgi:hypothetical protein